MSHEPPASFLPRWLQQAEPEDPEPADLGTAFGLDMSLLPPLDETASDSASEVPNEWLQRVGLPAR